jgi:hypothetical protein
VKITAEFNSNEELLNFISTFGTNTFKTEQGAAKTTVKEGKTKKDSAPIIEDKTPIVEAELISEEQPTDNTDSQNNDDPASQDPAEEAKITKEMVRALFTNLIKAGKQKEAKELTSKYGASKLPDVKEKDYAAIYKEAEGLL